MGHGIYDGVNGGDLFASHGLPPLRRALGNDFDKLPWMVEESMRQFSRHRDDATHG
jgi:hypothetical protein